MLSGGNPLTVGVGIVIEVIRKNNSDYDPEVGVESNTAPSSRDPIYLGTLLRLFAENVPKFMSLIMATNPAKKKLDSTFGHKLAPLGFDRFKTCELMAELLHCSNMGLLNEVGAEQVIVARDEERRRLRKEGKLSQAKEDEGTGDELTMRGHQGNTEESRRLEVTNADDDGFEEVEPSKEMSEDTSHEFVKAEEEVAQGNSGSDLLEKDEDDFMEEPLSSPRLSVGADKINEQHFEEADLVVAPLSPTKPKPTTQSTDDEPQPKSDSTDAKPDEIPETKKMEQLTLEGTKETHSGSATSSVVFTPTSSDQPEITLDTAHTEGSGKTGGTVDQELSPHPDDTPAPLFSAPPPPESGADRPPQASNQGNTAQTQVGDTQANGVAAQERSKITPPDSSNPVVGDFLKMQFVEHRVVPSILVSSAFFEY